MADVDTIDKVVKDTAEVGTDMIGTTMFCLVTGRQTIISQ